MKIIVYSAEKGFSEPIPESRKGVVVAIDSRLLSTHQLTLPKMSNTRAAKAIPFALDNQLLDEVDSLQFFSFQSRQNNTWDVFVIAKDLMRTLDQELRSAKCKPVAILPDFLLLPFSGEGVSYIENKDNDGTITYRNDYHQGGCLEASVFQKLFSGSSLVESDLSYDQKSKINLQQNRFSDGNQNALHPWRLPIAIATIALLLASAQLWSENNQLKSQLAQFKSQNEEQFTTLFPDVARIVNIRVQSKQALDKVLEKKEFYEQDLLSKLATEVFPNSKANQIILENRKLTLELSK